MANLGISHLSVGKSNGKTAGITLYKRALTHQLVHNRSSAFADCIVVTVIIQAISIKYHKYYWFLAHNLISLSCFFYIMVIIFSQLYILHDLRISCNC